MKPKARSRGITMAWMGIELYVYDVTASTMHRLDELSAIVWSACNGRRSIQEVAELVHNRLPAVSGTEAVKRALRRLEHANLMQDCNADLLPRQNLHGEGCSPRFQLRLPWSVGLSRHGQANAG